MINKENALSSYAIIKTGGKQYQAVEGATLAIEKLEVEPGQEVIFDEVLLHRTAQGFQIGTPFLAGVVVKATVVKHDKAKKVIIFKFKRRKKIRTKKGHRQPITVVRFTQV